MWKFDQRDLTSKKEFYFDPIIENVKKRKKSWMELELRLRIYVYTRRR